MVKAQRPSERSRSLRRDRSANRVQNGTMIWSVLPRKQERLAESARHNTKQNIPRSESDTYKLREAFIPKDDHAFVVADYCLAAGTLLDTPDGTIPIEAVKVDSPIYTYNHKTNRPDCSHVVAKKCTGIRPTMVVVLDNGERVRCTKDHRWLLADGSEIKAGNLIVGDLLLPLGCLRPRKVAAIECDNISVETWDIEVARDHNFALAAGVFVHNCQLEMRLLAHMSKEQNMIDVINKGWDIHAGTACLMFDHDYEELQAALKKKKAAGKDPSVVLSETEKAMCFHRQAAKSIGFGRPIG